MEVLDIDKNVIRVEDKDNIIFEYSENLHDIDEEEICVCPKIVEEDEGKEQPKIKDRQIRVLSTVDRTQEYLKKHRIEELMHFLYTKLLAHTPKQTITFLHKLIDDCMLFRAGHCPPPLLFEDRHLKAVLKSFDPGNRGWLTGSQVKRAFTSIGLTHNHSILNDCIATDEVFEMLRQAQEEELFKLISAGSEFEPPISK